MKNEMDYMKLPNENVCVNVCVPLSIIMTSYYVFSF